MNETHKTLSDYEKGMLVMNYLKEQKVDSTIILDAICDENLETSYRVIVETPDANKEKILTLIGITENKLS